MKLLHRLFALSLVLSFVILAGCSTCSKGGRSIASEEEKIQHKYLQQDQVRDE